MEIIASLNRAATRCTNFTIKLANFSQTAEDWVRVPGSIPYLGVLVAVPRSFVALFQMGICVTNLWVTGISGLISSSVYLFVEKGTDAVDHLLQMQIAVRMGAHGLLNNIRSQFEMSSLFLLAIYITDRDHGVPTSPLLLFPVNLLLFSYDLIVDNRLLNYLPSPKIVTWPTPSL